MLPTFVALCLGALVGLERQVAQTESQGEKDFPGVRTFAFTSLLGALAVLVANAVHPLLAVAIFVADAVFLILRYRFDSEKNSDPGYTTETASLCTFAVGAIAQSGELLVATMVTIVMVVLLRSKRTLHRAAHLLSPADMEALIRFLVITGIVLPILPDTPIDPTFQVLYPRDVWRMVVLISGLSFLGYVLMRVRAGQASYVLTGLLAGLVSSTAATLAYARAGRGVAHARHYESLIALAASTAFLRMEVMLWLVAPELAKRVLLPLGAMIAVGLALGFTRHQSDQKAPERHNFENPLTMRVAITFAAIYASVTLLLAYARQEFGDVGIYSVSAVAALVGADAPALSLARLREGRTAPDRDGHPGDRRRRRLHHARQGRDPRARRPEPVRAPCLGVADVGGGDRRARSSPSTPRSVGTWRASRSRARTASSARRWCASCCAAVTKWPRSSARTSATRTCEGVPVKARELDLLDRAIRVRAGARRLRRRDPHRRLLRVLAARPARLLPRERRRHAPRARGRARARLPQARVHEHGRQLCRRRSAPAFSRPLP